MSTLCTSGRKGVGSFSGVHLVALLKYGTPGNCMLTSGIYQQFWLSKWFLPVLSLSSC